MIKKSIKKKITVALIGNPNSGKSTIFNKLTGSRQDVGNYPGVTVTKKECLKNYKCYSINFVDLPGTYSLSAYSEDEVVVTDFLINEKPDIIINVIDASNIERNLYLFTQIIELNIPIIISLNMTDILMASGMEIDKSRMSNILNVQVLDTSLTENKKKWTVDVFCHIFNILNNTKFEKKISSRIDYGKNINYEIEKIKKLILKNFQLSKFPENWLSVNLLNNDQFALKFVSNICKDNIILNQVNESRGNIKEFFGREVEIEITNIRYNFTSFIARTILKEAIGAKKKDVTESIDNLVLNKYLCIPIFILVMYSIFKFVFVFSGPVINIFKMFIKRFRDIVGNAILNEPIKSLIVDGIINGIGSVLEFFPLILFMFFAIAFFENSGYMARATFIMNRIMNTFGLHGKSFLPLMISTNGCAVPGIFATRILDSKRDRLITMLVVPFMVCGGKIPVFMFIINAFFSSKNKTRIMLLVYILSFVIAFAASKILSMTFLKTEKTNFIIELPPYHIPRIRSLFLRMWEMGWFYLKKAGIMIMLVSVFVWIIFSYPKVIIDENLPRNIRAELQLKHSLAGRIGKTFEPLFRPIGMDVNKSIALLAGIAAKEVIVSTLSTIYSIEKDSNLYNSKSLSEKISLNNDWSILKGLTFLVFCMIYTPCISCVVVFFKESGSSYKWLALIIIGNAIIAWLISFLVFQIGTILKIGV